MPRDSNGFYTLPLNPVSDGDIIEAAWANSTMGDVAVQLNNIITRDGLLGPTEPFLLANGSALLPGLAFNTQQNLGFYRDAVNAIGVSAGGVTVAKFSDVQVDVHKPLVTGDKLILAGSGSASAPTLTVFDDLNTGFYSPAPDVVALATNGVERMRWDASGYVSNTVPIGTLLDFAGSTAPPGYLVCDGSAVSRTTYAALFAVIGTTWGVGDGTTTFNLPDLRRRTTIGVGGTAAFGPGVALGDVGGSEGSILDIGSLPSHSHGIVDAQHQHGVSISGTTGLVSNDHTHSGVTDYQGQHQHISGVPGDAGSYYGFAGGLSQQYGKGGTVIYTASYYTSIDGSHYHNFTTGGISANHSHGFAGSWASDWRWSGINGTQATGGTNAFNNMQPSVVVNKIIRAL